MSIDVGIPEDRNVIKKEGEGNLKYKELTTEIQCVWNVKAEVITVIIGVTGTISTSLRQYLSNIRAKHKIKNYKNSHIGHCTYTLESTNVKVK